MDDSASFPPAALSVRGPLFEAIFANAGEGIMITTPDGIIVDVNARFSRITGFARDEVVGRNPRILQSGRQKPEFYAELWRALHEQGAWRGEIWNRRKNGEVFAELSTITAVCDETGAVRHYVAQFTDVTAQKEQQHKLQQIAHFDTLTGLPNRTLLGDRLRQAMERSLAGGRNVALGYVDIDGLKSVNDQLGHVRGDDLLTACAQRMRAMLRETDTLARVGSDEFVLVIGDLAREADCEPLLLRLLDAVAAPLELDGRPVRVSASIGVTFFPRGGADADQLIRQADQAMTMAKHAGKNRYRLFDVEYDRSLKQRRLQLMVLRAALERGEFVLHCQPKIDMRTGALAGAEALIRWRQGGQVLGPAEFLPLLEGDELEIEVGSWVIREALALMARWRGGGLELGLSVNVSARQFQRADFVASLQAMLAAHPQLPPFSLELELLETAAVDDLDAAAETMRRCQELGVSCALDDFGTGYSSLSYLKRLPAGLLKIDQSFVRDMHGDSGSRAIVEAVVGLGRVFRRRVIAEGVETAAHARTLLALGCQLGQGYGIARPMPADELPAWVEAWRRSCPGWMECEDGR